MAIVRTGETEFDKEMAKWDAPKRLGGMNANGYEDFPAMLYKARVKGNGQPACMDIPPTRMGFPGGLQGDQQWDAAVQQADAFTRACQRLVRNGDERDAAVRNGWCETPAAALAAYEAEQQAIGLAAAEANYAATRMSEKAQKERKQREAATDKHLPE